MARILQCESRAAKAAKRAARGARRLGQCSLTHFVSPSWRPQNKFDTAQINADLTCPLCKGIFREAVTIGECMHTVRASLAACEWRARSMPFDRLAARGAAANAAIAI